MEKKIKALTVLMQLSGVESRTSSPVRIVRDKDSWKQTMRDLPMGKALDMQAGLLLLLWMA